MIFGVSLFPSFNIEKNAQSLVVSRSIRYEVFKLIFLIVSSSISYFVFREFQKHMEDGGDTWFITIFYVMVAFGIARQLWEIFQIINSKAFHFLRDRKTIETDQKVYAGFEDILHIELVGSRSEGSESDYYVIIKFNEAEPIRIPSAGKEIKALGLVQDIAEVTGARYYILRNGETVAEVRKRQADEKHDREEYAQFQETFRQYSNEQLKVVIDKNWVIRGNAYKVAKEVLEQRKTRA